MPPLKVWDQISREQFKQWPPNFTRLSGPVSLTNLPKLYVIIIYFWSTYVEVQTKRSKMPPLTVFGRILVAFCLPHQLVAFLLSFATTDANCVNEVDTHGRTAIMYATNYSSLDSLQLLLDQEAPVNAQADGLEKLILYRSHCWGLGTKSSLWCSRVDWKYKTGIWQTRKWQRKWPRVEIIVDNRNERQSGTGKVRKGLFATEVQDSKHRKSTLHNTCTIWNYWLVSLSRIHS